VGEDVGVGAAGFFQGIGEDRVIPLSGFVTFRRR
jgi:hypothetical protein